MRTVALACLTACTIPLVSTDRAHIDTFSRTVGHNHSAYYKKLGVTLGGDTCGDQYMRAVAGVPEAERLMRSCAHGTTGFELGILGAVVFPAAGIAADHAVPKADGTAAIFTGIGLGAASLLTGLLVEMWAGYKLSDAVSAYNREVDSGVEQR